MIRNNPKLKCVELLFDPSFDWSESFFFKFDPIWFNPGDWDPSVKILKADGIYHQSFKFCKLCKF